MMKYVDDDLIIRYAEEEAMRITVRDRDENGNPYDHLRMATDHESEILSGLIAGAILAIRDREYGAYHRAVIATAEYSARILLPYINSSLSIHCPISDFMRGNP